MMNNPPAADLSRHGSQVLAVPHELVGLEEALRQHEILELMDGALYVLLPVLEDKDAVARAEHVNAESIEFDQIAPVVIQTATFQVQQTDFAAVEHHVAREQRPDPAKIQQQAGGILSMAPREDEMKFGAANPDAVRVAKIPIHTSHGCQPEWSEFQAAGYQRKVAGVIFDRRDRIENGLPLGAIDTGRLDINTDGTFGYCTIFNSICPQRGPLRTPFLGLTAGEQVWLLTDPRDSFGGYMWSVIQTPTNIRYWGHYPIADLEFEMHGSPVTAGLRAWAPFLPGNSAASNMPAAVFEVHLRNVSGSPQRGRLAFSFPGPTQAEAQISEHSPREKIKEPFHGWVAVAPENTRVRREEFRGGLSGISVTSEKVKEIGYVIGAIGEQDVAMGGSLSAAKPVFATGRAWPRIGMELPPPREDDFGGSVSVGYELQPGQDKTVRLVLAWYAPMWIGEGDHTFMHMYATRYKSARAVAESMARDHESLIKRVLAWQQVLYDEQQLPPWLREALINILHLFPINSLWAAARPPIQPWCRPEDGLFGLLDGIVEDPAIEPIPDTFYANPPLVCFFPDLALSTLRGYRNYQFPNGAAVWIFGGVVGKANGGYEVTAGPEFAMPTPGYQTTTNGPCYVDMVDRYLLRTGDQEAMREFYPSIKRNTIYTMGLRPEDGADGIISVPASNVDPSRPSDMPGYHLEWFEAILFFGMTSHVGGIHLANLRMAERLAERAGDEAFAAQCRKWFAEGSASMEGKMWAGNYYLNYYEPKSGRKSDSVFAYQLDGQWMARFHGLPGVFRAERVKQALQTIRRTAAALTPYGAVNLAAPTAALRRARATGRMRSLCRSCLCSPPPTCMKESGNSGWSLPDAWYMTSPSAPVPYGTRPTWCAATLATGSLAATTTRT